MTTASAGVVSARTPENSRVAWMDLLRGLLVLLVILVHAVTIPTLAYFGSGHHPLYYQFIAFLSPYRMPGLMLLSGMLVERSLAKGFSTYFTGKTRHVLYPFVIWAIVIPVVTSGFVIITSGGLGPFLLDAISGGGGVMWYLWFLFVAYVLFFLVQKVPIGVTIAVSIVLAFVVSNLNGFATWFLYLFAFFATGALISRHFGKLVEALKSPLVMVATGIPMVVFSVFVVQGLNPKEVYFAPLVLCGVVFLMSLSYYAAKLKFFRITLGFVGRHSLIYYVTQIVLIANYSLFVTALNVPIDSLRLALVVLLTIATATLVVWLTRKVPVLNAFFVLPWSRRTAVDSGKVTRKVDFGV